MPTYRIEGADATTGEERVEVIEAANDADATEIARESGLFVSASTLLHDVIQASDVISPKTAASPVQPSFTGSKTIPAELASEIPPGILHPTTTAIMTILVLGLFGYSLAISSRLATAERKIESLTSQLATTDRIARNADNHAHSHLRY